MNSWFHVVCNKKFKLNYDHGNIYCRVDCIQIAVYANRNARNILTTITNRIENVFPFDFSKCTEASQYVSEKLHQQSIFFLGFFSFLIFNWIIKNETKRLTLWVSLTSISMIHFDIEFYISWKMERWQGFFFLRSPFVHL